MIKLDHICKTYSSKNHVECQALKDINLSFDAVGIVFLLGKSGSGKSTLLNIIGGLDAPTSGSFTVDHTDLQRDERFLNQYRNTYVGFVFQDYNLIDNLTVEENLSLVLQFQKSQDGHERISETLKKVGLEGAEKKYPFELSGGQKQRVAIARALVKDSKIILADEPTGNLDSENGQEILKLLKELSADKLVIVVSHDEENANAFGDRIIRISDGQVVSDSDPEIREERVAKDAAASSEFNIGTKIAFKLGLSNLNKKKIKTALTMVVTFLSLFIIMISYVLLSFSSEKAIARTVKKYDVEYIELFSNGDDRLSMGWPLSNLIDSRSDEILKKYDIDYIKLYNHDFNLIESKEELTKLGFEFYAVQDLQDDSIYVTDYWIQSKIQDEYLISDNGGFTKLDKSVHTYDKIVGHILKRSEESPVYWEAAKEYKIAGIIKTDYEKYYDSDLKLIKPDLDGIELDIYKSEYEFFWSYFADRKYCLPAYASNYYNDGPRSFKFEKERTFTKQYAEYDSDRFEFDFVTIYNDQINSEYDYYLPQILDSNSVKTLRDFQLKDNEVIITVDDYNLLFGYELDYDRIFDEDNNVVAFPSNIGKEFRLTILKEDTGEYLFKDELLKVVGVELSTSSREDSGIFITMSSNRCSPLGKYIPRYQDALIRTDNPALAKALKELRKQFNMGTDSPYSKAIYGVEEMFDNFGYTFLVVGGVMIIITILTFINLISFSIMSQKKEIGILRALGASKADIIKIYIVEIGVIAIATLLVSCLLTGLFIIFTNISTSRIAQMPSIPFVGFEFLTFLISFVFSFVLLPLFALLPLRKIAKMKPIDAIKKMD